MSGEFIHRNITVLENGNMIHDQNIENITEVNEAVNLEEEKEKILDKVEIEAKTERRELYCSFSYLIE